MSRATILGILGLSGFNNSGDVFTSRGGTGQPSFSAANVGAGVASLNFDTSSPLTRIATNASIGVVTLSAVAGRSDMQVPDWITGNHVTNFSTLQQYLSATIYSNRNISASAVSIEQYGSFPGTAAYEGAVLAPNGKIYLVPDSATVGRIFDPNNNSVTTYGSFPALATGFQGAVLAPNGKI